MTPHPTHGGLIAVDAMAAEDAEGLLGRVQPHIVVNCVGEHAAPMPGQVHRARPGAGTSTRPG